MRKDEIERRNMNDNALHVFEANHAFVPEEEEEEDKVQSAKEGLLMRVLTMAFGHRTSWNGRRSFAFNGT